MLFLYFHIFTCIGRITFGIVIVAMDPLTDDLKHFILENIDSIERLEVLILLHRDSSRHWTAEAVNQELRSNIKWVQSHLEVLTKLNILQCEDKINYFYKPQTTELESLCSRLIQLYKERRVMVINFIYNQSAERIKSLADAFKIRRD